MKATAAEIADFERKGATVGPSVAGRWRKLTAEHIAAAEAAIVEATVAPKRKRDKSATIVNKPSAAALWFLAGCEASGLPKPVAEYRFDSKRKWRFDWAWVPEKVALEVEGGAYCNGRHNRGKGFIADMAKYNRAVVLSWRLIRCTPSQVTDGSVFEILREVLA